MTNQQLHIELVQSQIRYTNCIDALKFGLFGTNREEAANALKEYHMQQKELIDQVCERINKSIFS